MNILRIYLLILGLFEFLPLVNIVYLGNPLDGFAVNLRDGFAERRLWCVMLLCLMFSRLLAFVSPSRPVLIHLAAVHCLEFVFMFYEQRAWADAQCPQTVPAISNQHLDSFMQFVTSVMALSKQTVLHIANCPGGGDKEILGIVFLNHVIFTGVALTGIGATPSDVPPAPTPKGAPKPAKKAKGKLA